MSACCRDFMSRYHDIRRSAMFRTACAVWCWRRSAGERQHWAASARSPVRPLLVASRSVAGNSSQAPLLVPLRVVPRHWRHRFARAHADANPRCQGASAPSLPSPGDAEVGHGLSVPKRCTCYTRNLLCNRLAPMRCARMRVRVQVIGGILIGTRERERERVRRELGSGLPQCRCRARGELADAYVRAVATRAAMVTFVALAERDLCGAVEKHGTLQIWVEECIRLAC